VSEDTSFVEASRYRLESLLAHLVRLIVRFLPMSVVRTIGRGIGRVLYVLNGPRRRIALENLEYAFPARPARERRALASAMFAHFGGLLLELIKFSMYSEEQMLAASDMEGLDRVRQAQRQGKGVLFFTGHFGYWEINALVHALTLGPMSLLARPLDNPSLHRMLEEIRTLTGNTLIYRQGAVRKMIRDLAGGKGIAVLIDQHLGSPDAIYVGFFQRRAATTSALAALALRMGSPVIPVFALPLPGGRYRFIYEHPVDPPRADTPDAVREFTQRCTDVLEMYVRRHPDLWMWMHRRWREAAPSAGDVSASDAEADA
jgi:KDO2-lipid IV(A) lauroyltransferase